MYAYNINTQSAAGSGRPALSFARTPSLRGGQFVLSLSISVISIINMMISISVISMIVFYLLVC